jgi:biotin synthase
LDAAHYAYQHNFGSLVIQAGERSDKLFVRKISALLKEIQKLSNGDLKVTLSLGEQVEDTFKLWRESGAHRYLLRIETSNRELYAKLHPKDRTHSFDERLNALVLLRKTGYQVGTGVMVGMPFQTMEDLADDLLFIKSLDVDMVGMGPYVEHELTPLYKYKNQLLPKSERFELSMKMIALLRILMLDINMAATTAMQTLHPQGREIALRIGANVLMPNLTPIKYREGYQLYADKPNIHEDTQESLQRLELNCADAGCVIAYDEWGDSKHFSSRQKELPNSELKTPNSKLKAQNSKL